MPFSINAFNDYTYTRQKEEGDSKSLNITGFRGFKILSIIC